MRPLFLFCFLLSQVCFAQQPPRIAFTLTEKDLIPEGIAYDPGEKAFYLSSIFKRKIVKITADGKAVDFVRSGQDSIKQVLGMKVDHQGRLWACNNSPEQDSVKIAHVHVYDLKTGKLVNRFTLKDGRKHLFNDLHFFQNGDTYITDSEGGGIYVIRKDSKKLESFLKDGSLIYPNGITATADEKKLLVSTGSALGIVSVNIADRTFASITHERFMIIGTDGLYRYNNTLVGIQNVIFPEAVLSLKLSDDASKFESIQFASGIHPLFDTPTTGVIVGDEFYFIANSQLLQIVGNQGQIKNPQKLADTYIMKIKLN
jgi:hypothetical protein